jgi:excisionase family DNA binding protein
VNLTARQAAERLNVPHPHLLILLSEGEIPSRKIGRHRFVREEDLLDYKAKRDAERRRILDKMVRDAEEAGPRRRRRRRAAVGCVRRSAPARVTRNAGPGRP